jgi:hypothetical protein
MRTAAGSEWKLMLNRFTNRRAILAKRFGLMGRALTWKPAALCAAGKAETAVPPSSVTMPPRLWGKDVLSDAFPETDGLTVDQGAASS